VITPASYIPKLADVAAHYDDLDDFYRSVWGTSIHHGYWITGRESAGNAVQNLTRFVAEQAALRRGDRVCDIGCGYGATALALNRDYAAAVTGITISARQYEHATRAAAHNSSVNFLLCDALQNGLPSGVFDAVIAIESTEHIAAKSQLFTEAHRILRTGGRLVIAAWLARDLPSDWQSKYLLEPICTESRLPSLGSFSEYREMLEDAGFRAVKFIDLTRSVKRTWTICALRLGKHFFSDRTLRRRLFNPSFTNRVFAKTIFRIRLAYATGSMRYGIFSADK
jgi:cyclopropane fatty-acyl-phospholipid synthase-like methyltransferase